MALVQRIKNERKRSTLEFGCPLLDERPLGARSSHVFPELTRFLGYEGGYLPGASIRLVETLARPPESVLQLFSYALVSDRRSVHPKSFPTRTPANGNLHPKRVFL